MSEIVQAAGARAHRMVFFALLLATPVAGQAESAGVVASCRNEPRDAHTLVVDANTGAVLHGGARHPQGSQIKVVVTGKNPFKYAYRVDTTVAPLEEAVNLAFLRLLPGWSGLPSEAKPQAMAEKEIKPEAGSCIGAAQAAFAALEDKSVRLGAQIQPLAVRAETVRAASERYNAFVAETDRDAGACEPRLASAVTLLDDLPTLVDLGPLVAGAKKLAVASADVAAALEALDTAIREGGRCDDAANQQVERMRAAQAEADKMISAIQAIAAAKADFQAAQKLLKRVLSDESAFEEVHRPFVPDSPTNVQVTVFRKNLRQEGAKEQQVVSIPIHVGQSRLAISGGFGFSGIDRRQVVRQAGPVADGEGGVKTGSVFGLEEDSSFRPTVAVLLHGSLWTSTRSHGVGRIGVAATSGVVTTGTGDGRKVDFLLGGSLSLLDEQLFVTVAFHAAEVADLGAGYEVGSPIPADLDDPLPTTKRWAKGLFAGLTFRIR